MDEILPQSTRSTVYIMTPHQAAEKALQDKVKAEKWFEHARENLLKKNHAYAVAKDAVRALERKEWGGSYNNLKLL